MPASFNALSFAEHLTAGGFSDTQAKALAMALWELIDTQLATKQDMYAMEQRLDARIDTVELRLNAQIDTVEQRLIGKMDTLFAKCKADLMYTMISLLVVQSGITAVLFKLLH